ncbi:MAG: hypothetical protein WC781_00950 [Candidatus Pacearchaeota archaeon]|jgi:hypothetical protein
MKLQKTKIRNITLLIFGLFLLLDGIISIFWAMPDTCLNNSVLGNVIRIIRATIGGYLVYISVKK